MMHQVQFPEVTKKSWWFICLCLEGYTCLVPQSSKQELWFRNRKAEGEIPIDVILDAKTISELQSIKQNILSRSRKKDREIQKIKVKTYQEGSIEHIWGFPQTHK